MEDLERLITDPVETETAEYKGWLGLHTRKQNNHRALLAKALIAMRNSDGGHVVLGFNDEKNKPLAPLPRPEEYNEFDGDVVQSIVKQFADPEFQCRLDVVEGHPVISVPSGVSEPVIASGGSQDNKTLVHGKYYIRCPGPESREPKNGLEWKNLIDRCFANNRNAIVNKIIPVIRQLEELEVIEVTGADSAIKRIEGLLDD